MASQPSLTAASHICNQGDKNSVKHARAITAVAAAVLAATGACNIEGHQRVKQEELYQPVSIMHY